MAWSLFKFFSRKQKEPNKSDGELVASKLDDNQRQSRLQQKEKIETQETFREREVLKKKTTESKQQKTIEKESSQQKEILRLQKKLRQQQALRKQRELQKRKEAKQETHLKLEEESKGLLVDLNNLGLEVDSVADITSLPKDVDFYIPLLLTHLNMNYSDRLLAIIVRALTIPLAEGIANHKLFDMFKTVENDNLRSLIGNALATVASNEDVEQLLEILTEPSYGKSRSMLVHGLARLQKSDAIPSLVDCLNDEDLVAQSAIALGNLKAIKAKKALRKIKHDDPQVMALINQSLRKIEGSNL